MSNILVVAFKYNDILYALGTSEFQASTYKTLVIFYINGRNPKDFPLQECFDEVEYVQYQEGIGNLWKNLMRIRSKKWDCDVLTFSNPTLLATKYIAKLSKAKKILWLEDGLMNYYPLSDIHYNSSRLLKRTVQFFLGLNDNKIFETKELITYLLCPEMAVSYWGEIKMLCFDNSILRSESIKSLSFIKGKKIFIGQALYNYNISKEYYIKCVNKIIREYNIDYYVPHIESEDERIECEKLNLKDYHVTFEYLACTYDFTLFSIRSTLLYSTKKINPKVKSYMLEMEGVDNNKPILLKTVNGIIRC